MISVLSDGNGYTVKSSNPGSGVRGWSMKAKTIKDVHLMIDHYFVKHYHHRNCLTCKALKKKKGTRSK